MTQNYTCNKCGGKMVKGVNLDFSEDRNVHSYYPAFWVEGDPVNEISLFGNPLISLDLTGKKKYMIRSMRCENCGLLENYAV